MAPFLITCFTRIDWSGSANVNPETSQMPHLLRNSAIPSENLDVLLPREMQLDDLSLEEKLVMARRGGYCSGQNGVFERTLRGIGFDVRNLLGHVVLADPPSLPPRTHRLLLAELQGEQWTADVGFGGQALTVPIRLQANSEQKTPHGEYWLIQGGEDWILRFRHHEHWQSVYRFDLVVQHWSDYLMGNLWSAHWPQSHFRHHLLMCRHLPDDGKLALTNFHSIHYQDGHAVEQTNSPDVANLYTLLQGRFGLGMDDMRHGFTEDELAMIVVAFDTHPEAGKQGHRN